MDYKVKSYVMLSIIFALGFMAGMLVNDLMSESPYEQIRNLRGSGGFMMRMEDVLNLNNKQKEEIKPILEKYEKRMRTFLLPGASFFHSITDSLKAELKPHLTEEQIKKLDEEFQRPIPSMGGRLTNRFDRGGFANRLEEVLELSEEQMKNVKPMLEKYDKSFQIIIKAGVVSYYPSFDSLKAELIPFLTKKQIQKLEPEIMFPFPAPDEMNDPIIIRKP